jgi:hypothetical protein
MRNLEAEKRIINRIFMFAGAGFIAGIVALAIGSEMLVLTFYPDEPIKFWCWQGIWAIVHSFIVSGLARIIKTNG